MIFTQAVLPAAAHIVRRQVVEAALVLDLSFNAQLIGGIGRVESGCFRQAANLCAVA
jgi:hypothetical protein